MNLEPLLSKLQIVDTRAHLIPFTLNWSQREYLAEFKRQWDERKLVRIIVLKARQLGISTLTEGIMFSMCFLFERVNGLVIAHEVDSAQHLLGMTQTYWNTSMFKLGGLYHTEYKSRNQLSWVESKSGLKVSTAANVDTGRSKTLQMLHASEVAFWDHAMETMGGLDQAFHYEPGTFGCIESTANGVGGFFYEQWTAAVDGEIEYKPLFFPWWRHPQYTWSYISRLQGGASASLLSNLDEEERVLVRLGVDEDHLLWRRWAIRNLTQSKIELFHQEYPSTPEEAFVATGTNIFPLSHLRACYEPFQPIVGRLIREGSRVKFMPDIAGPLKIYAYPSSDTDYGKYFVAGDPTRTTHGDNACAQVINRRTYEQVAVWRGKIDAATFAEELAKLAIYYNQAVLTCETTGAGYICIGALINMNYPHLYKHRYANKEPSVVATEFGWDTNQQRKEWMIGFLLKLVVDHILILHDEATFFEMRNYVTLPNGGYGPNSTGGHDDCVTSLAMATVCSSTEVLMAYSGPVPEIEPPDTYQDWGQEPA
jgi:hypothetical protein